MKRNVLLFISLCVVGCVMTYAQQMPGLLQKGKADTQDCKAWVDEQLSEMSLKEKIGQLFIHTVAPLQTQRNKNNIYAYTKKGNQWVFKSRKKPMKRLQPSPKRQLLL